MRNKVSLVLMEQLIMLLVFSLAAAACLGVFVGAHRISQTAKHQDTAVFLAQNGAETLKSTCGNLRQTGLLLSGTVAEDLLTADYEGGYRLYIQKSDSPTAGLGTAELWVIHESAPDEKILTLNISWQEVD